MKEEQLTLKDVADAYANAQPTPSDPADWKHTTAATQSNHTPLLKYEGAKRNAAKRGIPFELTFGEWHWYWLASGKWDERGSKGDQYCMARRGPDIGPYVRGNVDIKTVSENLNEAVCTPERKAKLSKLYTGTSKSADTKNAMSAAAKARVERGDVPPDRSKPFSANGVVYPSLTDAAKACGISREAMYKRMKSKPHLYKHA